MVVGAWLIEAGLAATPCEAVAMLRAVRPNLVVRPETLAALQAFHHRHGGMTAPRRSLVEVRA
jgi:protein-tyrosine phosphatase